MPVVFLFSGYHPGTDRAGGIIMKQLGAESYWGGIIKALGLVFGDIGTSPIYTLTVITTLTKPSQENIYGIISLIFWTLVIKRQTPNLVQFNKLPAAKLQGVVTRAVM